MVHLDTVLSPNWHLSRIELSSSFLSGKLLHRDHIMKIMNVVMKGADPKVNYEDTIVTYVAEVDRRLAKHGKQYISGSNFTWADCVAAVTFLCWVYND